MSTYTYLVQLLKIIIPPSNRYQFPNLKPLAYRNVIFNLLIDALYLPLKKNQTKTQKKPPSNKTNQLWLLPA